MPTRVRVIEVMTDTEGETTALARALGILQSGTGGSPVIGLSALPAAPSPPLQPEEADQADEAAVLPSPPLQPEEADQADEAAVLPAPPPRRARRVAPKPKRRSKRPLNFKCPDCDFASGTQGGLTRHRNQQHPKSAPPKSSSAGASRRLPPGERGQPKGPLEAFDDQEDYEEIVEIDEHGNVHRPGGAPRSLGKKPTINFKCPDCDFASGTQSGLTRHRRKQHPKAAQSTPPSGRTAVHVEGEYRCSICHKPFSKQSDLNRHMVMAHRPSRQTAATRTPQAPSTLPPLGDADPADDDADDDPFADAYPGL